MVPTYQASETSSSGESLSAAELGEPLISEAIKSLSRASTYGIDRINPDGHWMGELLSSTTITSEHVFFRQTLGLDLLEDGDAFRTYLLGQQNLDGSWSIAPDYPGDVSTSSEAYLALKILGVAQSSPIDKALYKLGGLKYNPLRPYSRKVAVSWIIERQEKEGDWAGIIPPMHQGIQALTLEGYKVTDPVVQAGITAIERFAWQDVNGKRIQACLSPVWDTVFMIRALCGAGPESVIDHNDRRIRQAVKWTKEQQILGPGGDWRIYQPDLAPGGFAFEYNNTWYPDVDDTAVAILAFLDQNPQAVETASVATAANWILGMQNSDGGWAAFDYDNDKLFLNRIPFSDMGALCDPSTADVTGRILEAFGLMIRCSKTEHIAPNLLEAITTISDKGITFLAKTQEADGSWYGRWGSNYIYGTSNALCGLTYFHDKSCLVRDLMRPAIAWLKRVQNEDGGFGEELITYKTPSPALRGVGESTASQTAWGLMGLLTVVGPNDRYAKSAVGYLVNTQVEISGGGRSWPERKYTGTGFPGHFYLGYSLYRHCFPMIALGRWIKIVKGAKEKSARGGFETRWSGQ
ncbi:Terpene cyclase family member [Venustampulla echinocandica]|uniref:Terpene cyclase family member n=1 Tax=Venustampulla echinocandica TaxID=2656787 RepID=A0A370TZU5_9HELO|nr:Terpene cyclase family member [Venustampulla echinocandica]RDL41030.1 Terpene cyclase family member [Venustampulla echinocandica]